MRYKNTDVVFLRENVLYINKNGRALSSLYEKNNLLNLIEYLPKTTDKKQEVNFVIFANNGPIYPYIIDNQTVKNKINILIYLSDETGHLPEQLSKKYDLVFKNYLRKGYCNIKPLPLITPDNVPFNNILHINLRPNTAFFYGNLNYRRLDFLENTLGKAYPRPINSQRFRNFKRYAVQKYSGEKGIVFTENFRTGLPSEQYAEALNNSKFALCPPGFFSNETFRHYEASRQGCVVITSKLPSHPFYSDSPFIQLENWSNVNETIENLLYDENELKEIQKKTIHWYENNLSPKAISNYISKEINEQIYKP